MRCWTAKKMLAAYLSGECRSREAAAVEKHLAVCRGCTAELEELRRLNQMLDLWPDEPAPAGLWDTVMDRVGETASTRATGRTGTGTGTVKTVTPGRPDRGKSFRPALLRDLVVAAAVSMIIFWGGSTWPTGDRMLSAGERINGAVSAYTRVTGTAMERATGAAGEYTRKILYKEWEPDEMPESPGS